MNKPEPKPVLLQDRANLLSLRVEMGIPTLRVSCPGSYVIVTLNPKDMLEIRRFLEELL